MPEAQGTMNLCLPAVVLNAILRRLISQGDRPKRRSKEARARVRELLGETKIGAVLQLPPLRLKATELASLSPGTILRLPLAKHSHSHLRVGGLHFGAAHPVRIGEHRGAQLKEVIDDSGSEQALIQKDSDETASVN
jgi:flagellar motor switch protein FliM